MKTNSPKQAFLNRGGDQDEDFDSLLRVEKTQYVPGLVAQAVHADLHRTKILRGGLGGGKSRTAGEHIFALGSAYPGGRFLIGRRDLPTLKRTTQHEFLEKVVVPEAVHTFNVNDNILYLKNRSEFHFIQVKSPDDFKSFEGVAYLIDEADENPSQEIYDKLNQRMRQRILIDGQWVQPPYCGLLVFNPTDDQHWLYHLAQQGEEADVADFRFSTYDNAHNLPDDYIPNLLKTIPPWDVPRLVHGHWGRQIKGVPVIHGFTDQNNVKILRLNERLPLLRGWDFGFNRPSVVFMQIDPVTSRSMIHREFLGEKQLLGAPCGSKPSVVDEVKRITRDLCGDNYPVLDYCDPHGADKKDNAESSVETLRIRFGIHCNYRRTLIKAGVDEIQRKVISNAVVTDWDPKTPHKEESLFLVDPRCPIVRAALLGGYHRDVDGLPAKDGFYDHLTDTIRYVEVHNMGLSLAHRYAHKKYVPRNRVTGY